MAAQAPKMSYAQALGFVKSQPVPASTPKPAAVQDKPAISDKNAKPATVASNSTLVAVEEVSPFNTNMDHN